MKEYKEEWLNPESPKYYKGFRYKKDEYGNEFWYDDNGKCRKVISYYDNGNKHLEIYYNENGEYHNEYGYAYQRWSKNGDIEEQGYYLNGEVLTEQEWKEKTDPNYYKGFKYEKDEYGNEYWFDENGNLRKKIVYRNNGKKYFETYYNEDGKFHNEDGFARKSWDILGNITLQEYCFNDTKIPEELFNYIKSLKEENQKLIKKINLIEKHGY